MPLLLFVSEDFPAPAIGCRHTRSVGATGQGHDPVAGLHCASPGTEPAGEKSLIAIHGHPDPAATVERAWTNLRRGTRIPVVARPPYRGRMRAWQIRDQERILIGSPNAAARRKMPAPNIRPDLDAGVGGWSADNPHGRLRRTGAAGRATRCSGPVRASAR